MSNHTQRQLIKIIAQTNLRITNIQSEMTQLKKEMDTLIVSREHNKTELEVLNFRLRKQNTNYHYDYERPSEIPPHNNS